MEMHQLRYFLSVARIGSFTGAAEDCHVSQPSLSAQIAKLEQELGGPLFERGRHGARITERGELLRAHAVDAMRELEMARREMDELSGMRRGRVAVGCLPTTGAYLLPRLLTSFLDRYPDIHIDLTEASSPQLAQLLSGFDIDLAIIDEAGLAPGLGSKVLFREPLVVALPPSHRLAGSSLVSLAALSEEPFILMKSGHGFRAIVVDALSRAGITPKVVYESDEIETVQRLVEAGLGVSLVPRMVCKETGPAYVQVAEPTPSRTLHIAYRDGANLTAAARAMRETALRVLGA